MQDGASANQSNSSEQAAAAGRGAYLLWPALAGSSLALAVGAVTARLKAGPQFDGLLIFAAGIAAVALALRLLIRERASARAAASDDAEPLRDLFESAGPGIVTIDLQGRLTWVNPSAERMLGYHADELKLEWSRFEILGPGEDARLVEELEKLCGAEKQPAATPAGRLAACIDCLRSLPAGKVPVFDAQLRRKDGALIPVTLHISALRDHADEVTGLVAVAVDQGASLRQDKAQRESQERFRAEELHLQQDILLDSVADGICGVDRGGRISSANPAAARLLGANAAGLTGKPVHELLHGAAPAHRRCGEECPLRLAQGRQKAAAGEDTIFRSDGSSFPAEFALTPIADQGRFSGSVLSFRDISQRHALDRLKDEFISTVSHELRTPLTSIRGALGLLSSGILGEVNDKASNLLRIALTNSDRLVRLINDILDLERIQSGKEPLTFRPVQLDQIISQAIDGMAPVAEAAGVQLTHDAAHAEIAADPDRLLQVLTNLLSNAVKFSPPGSTISVVLRPGTSGVTLSVIDEGRGIPADKLEAVFGRFQQVDASDSRQKGGSGLGLAICRTIVQQHSGRIWAERNPVRGSTFGVFLPYRPAPVEPLQSVFDQETGHGAVLVADSNPASRPHIVALLESRGYRVVQTTTVAETLAAAREGVEAILLDTSLDGMNGWEILPLLRRLCPDAHTPIVLLSVDKSQDPAALPADAEGWVANRHSDDALLGELARVLCGPGENARILIVEDDVDLARVIGEVFLRDSIEVRLAHSLEQALDACFAFQPHLLVLDIGLPDGDGFNVVDWLRKHESLARLPLVVYSGRELSHNECRKLTLGPTQFLTKARVQPQQLEALVLTMLRSSRHVEEAAQPEPLLKHPGLAAGSMLD